MVTDKVDMKIPAVWKRSMVEPIMVGMPFCLSLLTLLGFSSSGPSIGLKSAVTKRTRQKRSCLPSHTSRNKVAALRVFYPKSEGKDTVQARNDGVFFSFLSGCCVSFG